MRNTRRFKLFRCDALDSGRVFARASAAASARSLGRLGGRPSSVFHRPRGKKHKFPLCPRGFELSKPRGAGGKSLFYANAPSPKTHAAPRRAQSPNAVPWDARERSQSRRRRAGGKTNVAQCLFLNPSEPRHGSLALNGLHLAEKASRPGPGRPNDQPGPEFQFWFVAPKSPRQRPLGQIPSESSPLALGSLPQPRRCTPPSQIVSTPTRTRANPKSLRAQNFFMPLHGRGPCESARKGLLWKP